MVAFFASIFALSGAAAIAAVDTNFKNIAKKEDVFIEAEQVDYDFENKLVVAQGKVEVMKGQTVLFADKIIYNQNDNSVTADGNVVTVDGSNTAIFSDSFTLSDGLKDGLISYFRARLSDGSLLAAAQAKRINANKIELEKAVYSPCPICATQPDQPAEDSSPQWQLKADKVTVDEAQQQVEYEDVMLEVYGTPVLYAPYFRHPTPDADRKSGFLPPELRTDANLGLALATPYYFNLSEDSDLTFTPTVTTQEGAVFAGDYRQTTRYGKYNFSGSVTRPRGFSELASNEADDKEVRGHIKATGEFDLTNTWDLGFDGEFATDDTYLRRYNFNDADLLTSRAYLQRINERNFSDIQFVGFQGLLEQDDQSTIPKALPYARNYFESGVDLGPELKNAKAWSKINSFAIEREAGSENRRFSFENGITIPFISQAGHVFEAIASVRADYYNQSGDSLDTNETRAIPEVALGWNLPLINQLADGSNILFQPIVKLIASPNVDYNAGIINEDSQDVEFSDLNIFERNRFRGVDLVESGTRANYGARGGYYTDGYEINFTVGQSYSVNEPKNLPSNSGLEDNLSDIVGSIGMNIGEDFDMAYRFRLDPDHMKAQRNEIDANLRADDSLSFNINYLALDYDFSSTTDNREEVSATTKLMVDENWAVLAGGRRNLNEGQNIETSIGLGYEGDCTNITTFISKEFISDRDFKAGTSFGVNVGLKNLGEI